MAMLAGTRNAHVTHIITAMSRPQPSRLGIERAKNGIVTSYRDTPSGGEKKFELPVSYFEDAEQYDMLDALSTCTKPKLYIYGTRDTDITPDIVTDTYEKSAEPKQICEIDSDHDYRRHPGKIDEVNHIVENFLAAHQ